MKPIANPNAWSCLPASFASVLEVSLDAILAVIGHDGSEITHAGLPDPLQRRGFHPQELIKVCLQDGKFVTSVELNPCASPSGTMDRLRKFDIGGWEWFRDNLFNSRGVLDCRTVVGTGHAMAYEGQGDHAIICDPGKAGQLFELRDLKEAEMRDRYLVALWRIDE